jgi:hypothetical protein
MRLPWHKLKSDAVVQATLPTDSPANDPAPVKVKPKRKPIAGVAGYMAISTEEGIQHPLAPRMKPHDERSNDGD